MKKIFLNTAPMRINYITSIILDIVLLVMIVYQLNFYPFNLLFISFIILYFMGSIGYYLFYKGDLAVSKPEMKHPNRDYSVAFFTSSIKYVSFSILFYVFVLLYAVTNWFPSVNISTPVMILTLCSAYFILTKSIFVVTGFSPLKTILIITIPLLIFMSVGIENALLNWTFLSLLLMSIGLQFFNKDVGYLLNDNFKTNNFLKVQITKRKYKFLFYIPILYISLLLSEKLAYNDRFLFYFNKYYNQTARLDNIDFVSPYNIAIALIKVIVISISIWLYINFDSVVNKILRFIAGLILQNKGIPVKDGHFYCRNSKEYYYFYKNIATDSKGNLINRDGNKLISSTDVKFIEKKSEYILRIEGRDYLHESLFTEEKKRQEIRNANHKNKFKNDSRNINLI